MCARLWCSWFLRSAPAGVVVCAVLLSAAPAVADDEGPGEAVSDAEAPQTPGLHHLAYQTQVESQPREMTYGLYLPHDYDKQVEAGRKLPLVVYLCGAGARGHERRRLFYNGPLAEMRKVPHLEPHIRFMVLAPQCPRKHRWESEAMGRYVNEVTRRVIDKWPVAPDRVHLLGMSMGGEGVWHTAPLAPELYATVTAVGGRKHEPDKVATALKDKTVWIVTGSADRDFATGSRVMAAALEHVGADVHLTELPGYGHNIWRLLFNKTQFYDWLMLHRRDREPPAVRPTGKQLVGIAKMPPPDPAYERFIEDLQEQFHTFRPYWFVENCAKRRGVGLRESLGGRENVFVTHPINKVMPCRLNTTAKIPDDKRTTLLLEVGHGEKQDWKLEVFIDNTRVFAERIGNRREAEAGWRSIAIDLTPYAGQAVFIELLNGAHRWRDEQARWGRIEIVSE